MDNKKIVKIIFSIVFTFACLFAFNTISQAASFESSISKTSVTVGDTFTVTVKANNAAGMYSVTSDNSNASISSGSGSEFLENSSATITFKAQKAGTVVITAKATDMTDLDDDTKPVTGSKTYSVTIKEETTNSSSGNTTTSIPTTTTPTFTSVKETVYSTSDNINVRSSYSTSSSVLGSLKKGESLTRIGVATKAINGITWSKVTYNGKTAYVSSAYLTKTKPATDEEKDNENDEKSSNKNLKSLTVTPSVLNPAFSASITEYTMTVENNIDEIKLDAVAEDDKAKVSIEGNTGLEIGENTITIKVTAEDETVRTYKIVVTKEAKNQIALKELLIEGVTLNPEFDSDVYQYTIDLENSDIKELNITATPDKEDATVEIIGNTNLQEGSNVITILVKLSENETATYQVIVNIPKQVVAEPENNTELYKKIGIGVLAAIILVIVIIAIVKMRKNDDDDDLEDEQENPNEINISSEEDEIIEDNYDYETEDDNETAELPKLKDKDLPKSLRKNTENIENSNDDKLSNADEERKRKIDDLYSEDEEKLVTKRKGKHF